jgi:hypothetical protein
VFGWDVLIRKPSCLCALASLVIVLVVEKGRLFKPQLRGVTTLER